MSPTRSRGFAGFRTSAGCFLAVLLRVVGEVHAEVRSDLRLLEPIPSTLDYGRRHLAIELLNSGDETLPGCMDKDACAFLSWYVGPPVAFSPCESDQPVIPFLAYDHPWLDRFPLAKRIRLRARSLPLIDPLPPGRSTVFQLPLVFGPPGGEARVAVDICLLEAAGPARTVRAISSEAIRAPLHIVPRPETESRRILVRSIAAAYALAGVAIVGWMRWASRRSRKGGGTR